MQHFFVKVFPDASLATIPEAIVGRISAPVSLSYLKWRMTWGEREIDAEKNRIEDIIERTDFAQKRIN